MIEPLYLRLMPDLPSPPQWLIDLIDIKDIPDQAEIGYVYQGSKVLDDWKGRSYETVHPRLKLIPDEINDWIRENIAEEFLFASSMYCPVQENMTSIGAHSDGVREFALIYNINSGGPDAKVEFWQEEGFPIARERAVQVLSTKNLNLMGSFNTPQGCWYLLDGRILHSLENLVECRVNLQVSFEKTLPEKVMSMAGLA